MKIETIYWLAIIGILAFSVGCQSDENPWQVEQYRSPDKFTPTPQSTYAPVPRILPSIEGSEFEPVGSGEGAGEELDRILSELQVN